MKHGTWFNTFAAEGGTVNLSPQTRAELSGLDNKLFAIWKQGDYVLLNWTHCENELLFLSVRSAAIAASVHAGADRDAGGRDAPRFINTVLSGPKYLKAAEFKRVCQAFNGNPEAVRVNVRIENEGLAALISDMVRYYGASLVRDRAVVLLEIVGFSGQSPLNRKAMLNSLANSVSCACGQMLQQDIKIDFAPTSTGDGFFIWNRATADDANTELYKLMTIVLADNAIAQRKLQSPWVPKLRAAFHVGEYYEFHPAEGRDSTSCNYIVGQVTVDLACMVGGALPGQILLGDSDIQGGGSGRSICDDTLDFVEHTAATLGQLSGLDISGGRIQNISCYLTGRNMGDGHYLVNRYQLHDKYGTMRKVYNAKINIRRDQAEPIFLGIRGDELWAFNASKVESLSRDRPLTGAFSIRP